MTSSDTTQTARDSQDTNALEQKAREQARLLALKIVVIVLGVILGAMALVVFSTLIVRAVKGRTAEAPAAAPVTPRGPAAAPAAARVVSTALGDGRFAVTYEHDGVLTVVLYDAATMRETGRATLAPPARP